jgi:two-component system response regulator AtoC
VNRDFKILVIDGGPARPNGIESVLKGAGYLRTEKVGPEKSLRELELLSPDATVVGPSVTSEQCYDCIRKLKIIDIRSPILVFPRTASPTEDDPLSHFHGLDFLSPDSNAEDLSRRVHLALKGNGIHEGIADLPVLVGRSPQMSVVRDRIHRVSDKDVTVLISGETGTGKEIIARSIHYFSHRRKGPLVKISCGNLPDQLLESEVFGFQKGAFTDAHRNKPGRLELADNGTLFLDEVGDLSLFLQVKFLQIFEDRSFSRLGATEEKMIDARVVAATHFDLAKKVRSGEFRRDLFYRLNVMHIRTVPLRERRDDIPLLADYFLKRYCSLLKKDLPDVPFDIMERFCSHRWPGNVRELENLVKRAIVLRSWDHVVQEMDSSAVPGQGDIRSHPAVPGSITDRTPGAGTFTMGDSLKEITKAYVSGIERKAILDAMDSVRWNRRKAAQLLGVSYKTICNRIKELGICP